MLSTSGSIVDIFADVGLGGCRFKTELNGFSVLD